MKQLSCKGCRAGTGGRVSDFHRSGDHWLSINQSDLDLQLQTKLALELGFSKQQADEAVEDFLETISRPAIQSLLEEDAYLKSNRVAELDFVPVSAVVKNEQAIQAMIDGGIMNGYVDRLVVFKDGLGRPVGADIIDYKTDLIDGQPGRTIREKTVHYRPQIEAYRESICQMFKISPAAVGACLVFVQTGQLVDVLPTTNP